MLAAMSRLNRDFFSRDTLTVARDLLGQRLVRVLDGKRLSGRIVEVAVVTIAGLCLGQIYARSIYHSAAGAGRRGSPR